ncbi:MAG: glycerol-3-phosphate dehydrogenase (NAD(P)+), partial [Rickettsiales bacterium]
KKLGGKPKENFVSPAGLGDLFLTCSSKKSRNNSLGVLIGKGNNIKEITSKGTTFEGFNASALMIEFAKKHQTTLPLCEKINHILQSDFSTKEIKTIISHAILSN